MGGRKGVGRLTPNLKMTGKGWRQDNASGFMRYAHDVIHDVRQGPVSKDFADLTPGFGTHHPRDRVALGNMSDPSPIHEARPKDDESLSVQDLRISDQEIRASIVEGRAPRAGF